MIAQHFARTGSVELVGWNRSALVGQIVALGPLGSSIIVQHLFVAALAVLGLLATYGWLVPRVGAGGATLGAALVGLTPDFGLLATSYMADIPAFTAVMVCLFLADRALRTNDVRYLLAALVVGTWGVTVREQSIVGPVVAVVVTVAAWRGTRRRIALVGGACSALVIVAFEVWRRSLPNGDPLPIDLFSRDIGSIATLACFSVALAVLPAALVAARPRGWSRRAWIASACVLVVAAAAAYARKGDVFLGNYLVRGGAYNEASVGTRSVLPHWWWFVLVVIGCLSLALIVGHFVDSGVSLDRMSWLVLLLVVGGTLAQAVLGQGIFARYFLVVIPIACYALLGRRAVSERSPSERSRRWLTLLVLLGLTTTSAAITANALAFDAAKWKVALRLASQGVAAGDIDAGFEWVGYHSSEPAHPTSAHAQALSFYMPMFGHSRECYVVSASPLDGLTLDSTSQYRTYALVGSSALWLYRLSPCR